MASIGNTLSIVMRRFALSAIIIVSLSTHSEEEGEKSDKKSAAPQAAKSHGLSTDVYEKEESASSFTAHVNLIRETDVIEVFFDGKNKGPYLLKDDPNLGVFKERLAKSKKNKNQNVTVKVADEVITNVEIVEIKATEKKKSDLDSVLSDILKK